MPQRVSVLTKTGDAVKVEYEDAPDYCPLCHDGISPILMQGGFLRERPLGDCLSLVFRCPRRDCEELFIAYYEEGNEAKYRPHQPPYELRRVAPKAPRRRAFPQEVATISPRFAEVFNQAAAAETQRLSEIAGGGYRKALEILIKDYVIPRNPGKEDAIRTSLLGKCIQDYVDDPKVKECASRAAWLGNDEVHYVRRWADKDINDLRTLVQLTVNWIHNEVLTEQYQTGMPRPSKS
jgi:hypothetical protein